MIEVVDVGANPIDGPTPYLPLLRAGLCHVTGFEPQPEALARLEALKGPLETYKPLVIGTGKTGILYVTAAEGCTSLLEPDRDARAKFPPNLQWGEVLRKIPVQTVRLNDAITHPIDFLKMDVQGGEYDVLLHGAKALRDVVTIQLEVSFVPLYHGQRLFHEIAALLRGHGMILHKFVKLNHWNLHGEKWENADQLVEADALFIRDPFRAERMTPEQLRKLSLILRVCYGSKDVADFLAEELRARESDPELFDRAVEDVPICVP